MTTIFFAGGCFWGIENYFQNLKGVIDTAVGYANSTIPNPTYEEVCSGKTGASETCKVVFDETILPFDKILNHFFNLIDPTTINRQGNDIGSQYRSGIYFIDLLQEEIIKKFVNQLQNNFKLPIVTEVLKLENFYFAEEYHQNYLIKNPSGYCHCLSKIENLKNSNDSKYELPSPNRGGGFLR